MNPKLALRSANGFALRLKRLRERRRKGQNASSTGRQTLTKDQRTIILPKTGGRCHICGGEIKKGEKWQADHVLAHALGGKHSTANYLAAHSICNSYRWHYGSEEFQWILNLGVWIRTIIEKRGSLGMSIAEKFVKSEKSRISRHKNNSGKSPTKPVPAE